MKASCGMVDAGGVYAAAEGNSAGSAVSVAELTPIERGKSLEAHVLVVEE